MRSRGAWSLDLDATFDAGVARIRRLQLRLQPAVGHETTQLVETVNVLCGDPHVEHRAAEAESLDLGLRNLLDGTGDRAHHAKQISNLAAARAMQLGETRFHATARID